MAEVNCKETKGLVKKLCKESLHKNHGDSAANRTQKLEASKTIDPAPSAASGVTSKAEALDAKLAAVKGGGGGRVRCASLLINPLSEC